MKLIYITFVAVQEVQPLRIRTHILLGWDEWHTPSIHHVGFLPLARLVTGDLPMMDPSALMALVDRWHPEIHLPCG
jgi:hypothetical protein